MVIHKVAQINIFGEQIDETVMIRDLQISSMSSDTLWRPK